MKAGGHDQQLGILYSQCSPEPIQGAFLTDSDVSGIIDTSNLDLQNAQRLEFIEQGNTVWTEYSACQLFEVNPLAAYTDEAFGRTHPWKSISLL